MAEPREPDDDERETLASRPGGAGAAGKGRDSEAPTGEIPGSPDATNAPGATAPHLGDDLDLVSLPPRPRPASGPSPRATGPAQPPAAASRDAEPDSEGATIAGEPRHDAGAPTEVPTSEVPGAEPTHASAPGAGTVADAKKGETVADDDKATIADAHLTARQQEMLGRARPSSPGPSRDESPGATVGDAAAGSASARSQGPVPASKWSRGTARDPVAGTAAGRGSVVGVRPGGPTQLAEGQLLADRYELIKRLGKGGMGEVWQARHTLLKGMRAIKVIKASISRDPAFRARFLSEGQTMMRVKHRNVVEVTDLDETRSNRELYMVMEHLQGRTLHDAVRDAAAPLCDDVRNVVRIHRELALGMQVIHDERIVHKDLKTDNVILVTGEDHLEHPKVIDFGLAKRMEDSDEVPAEIGAGAAEGGTDPDARTTLSGTLAYMSPEQFLGRPSSFQSDVYAFGVMLYECFLRGEYPMPRGSLHDYMRRHKEGEVPRRLRQARPDLDPFVAELADRCMAPVREQRPASFREIADEMQWWLDAPVRAARRRRVAAFAAAGVALASVAVYGFFFKRQPAGVQGVVLRGAGGAEVAFRGERFHLGAGSLASVAVEGTVTGEAGVPSVLVDGVAHAADVRVEGRRLAGTVSLADLSDGEHVLGVRAAEGADPAAVRILVDRTPPRVRGIDLADGAGGFTRSKNPALRIRLDTPASDLRGVSVEVAGGAQPKSADPDPSDPLVWTVSGLTSGEGEARVRVVAADLAGNRTPEPAEFSFVQDTAAPAADVRGLHAGRLQVRDAAGNRLRVLVGEDAALEATFRRRGESAAETRTAAATGGAEAEIDVPQVPGGGLDATLVAVDRAGNRTTASFPVEVVADEIALATPDGAARGAVRSSAGLALRIRRTYPIEPGLALAAARLRDAEGRPAAAAPVPLDAVVEPDRVKVTEADVRIRADLAPGEYGLSVAGAAGSRPIPFALVVDPDRPRLLAWTVRDAQGREVPEGAWCLTSEAAVEVRVGDLALATLTLGGAAPAERVEASRAVYTFQPRLAEGAGSLSLVARDEAGNDATATVPLRADWTDPRVELASPRPGDALDDKTPVVFAGRCTEDDYSLVVETPGAPDRATDHKQREFADQWLLRDGEYAVTVRAVDRAGRRSPPVVVPVRVAKRQVELPDVIPWAQGARSEMRKVAAGDVVIDGRTQPVPLVFLDRTEVTNRAYREFLAACAEHRGRTPWDHADQPAAWSHVPPAETWGDPAWSADDLPVVNVAWWDAWAFAKWSGRRLPTEAEWVKAAAKAPGELELRSWPPVAAGGAWKDGLLATSEATAGKGPVDATRTADESPAGCLHMGGNVSEWVSVEFAREGEPRTGVRGGNWWTSRFGADVRRVPTKGYDPSFRARTIGFRCAVDALQVQR